MARNELRTSKEQARTIEWLRGWKIAALWSASALLILFTAVNLRTSLTSPTRWGVILGTGLSEILLAFVLERSLAATFSLPRALRYRLAFLLSSGLAICIWFLFLAYPAWIPLTVPYPSAVVLLALAGAFTGSLLATGLQESLWENNYPPADSIQQAVYQMHLGEIGQPAREPWDKLWFDRSLALIGLIFSAPLWMAGVFVIWFEDPGPVLFVKNSVGKGGVNFFQFKFRTMRHGAESGTGPVLSREGDERVLFIGRFLRKTALDELPQLINILRGEMSFVGPRPQRTVLVHYYLQTLPEYAQRHCVLPGLAGLAQVAGDYYITPRQKLRFDRLYIRYRSLGFDLKLLMLAFLLTFWYRWQKGWDGRLPRKLMRRWGSNSKGNPAP